MKDDGTLFKDWQWGECLEYLNNIIHHSENIILVSGLFCSGKTTLKKEILHCLPYNSRSFSISGDSKINVSTFMQKISLGFGIPWENNLQPDWEELRRSISYEQEFSWILLVDDAEKLSWELLSSLIDLYISLSSEMSKFNLVLFADFSLQQNLRSSPLKDFFEVKFQKINLECLNYQQMIVFLYEHMKLDFDRKTLKRIYNASNGIIGKVKQLAIAELNIKNTKKSSLLTNLKDEIFSSMAIKLIICLGLLVIAGILCYLIQNRYSIVTHSKENNVVTTPSVKSIKDVSRIENQQLISEDLVQNNNIENHDSFKHETKKFNPTTDLNSTTDLEEAKYNELYEKLLTTLKANLQEQLAEITEQINQIRNNSSNILQNEKAIFKEKSKLISSVINKPKQNINFNSLNKHTEIDQQLLKVSKKYYVLQLMASKNEQSVRSLIKNYPELSPKVKYFSGKFKPQSDNWYMVIYGTYSNPELAIKDVKNLPVNLQKLKPLARDYGSIHELIQNKNIKNRD